MPQEVLDDRHQMEIITVTGVGFRYLTAQKYTGPLVARFQAPANEGSILPQGIFPWCLHVLLSVFEDLDRISR